MKIKNITLDSNVFRDQVFLDWLIENSKNYLAHIFPLIAYIEVLVWYEMTDLTKKDLNDDLEGLKTRIIPFSEKLVDNLLDNIRSTKQLPFSRHARDFLIGTIARQHDSLIITHNIRHFIFLPTKFVVTPEKFVEQIIT